MATATPAPYRPTSDNDARDAAFQILGSDIDHTWTGDWHQTLRDTATRWAETPTDACWFCSAPNPANYTRCGFCSHHAADAPTHRHQPTV